MIHRCGGKGGSKADFAVVKREAHILNGTVGGFGAMRLQHLAETLDIACREGCEDDALRLLTTVEPVAAEAFAALAAKYDLRPADSIDRTARRMSCCYRSAIYTANSPPFYRPRIFWRRFGPNF